MFFITVRTDDLQIPLEAEGCTLHAAMQSFVHAACKAYPDYLQGDCKFDEVVAWYVQHEQTVTFSYDPAGA